MFNFTKPDEHLLSIIIIPALPEEMTWVTMVTIYWACIPGTFLRVCAYFTGFSQ